MKQLEKLLLIDTTTQTGKICLGGDCVAWPAQGNAEFVLEKIDGLLKKHHLTMDQISAIKVNPGPGSFTGTRVGVAVANALAWSLHKPVNGLPEGQLVKPIYAHPPHITGPK